MSVLRSLFLTISGQILGTLGLQKEAFGARVVAKTSFSPKLDFFMILGSILEVILEAKGGPESQLY